VQPGALRVVWACPMPRPEANLNAQVQLIEGYTKGLHRQKYTVPKH
jgi:hypothetical protein